MTNHNTVYLATRPEDIVEHVFDHDKRVLLYGPTGIGKSTLVMQLARVLRAKGRHCYCICADPGSPAFGLPGAISLGSWEQDCWQVIDYEALCSLDAGRFRLPLVSAVRHLSHMVGKGVLLIDGPGVVRGIAGRELLHGLFDAARADTVLAITSKDKPPPLLDELNAIAGDVFVVLASEQARSAGSRARARQRTQLWNAHLSDYHEHSLELRELQLTGTPPPLGETSTWIGRQCALMQDNKTVAMGEILRMDANQLHVKIPSGEHLGFNHLLVRDAARSLNGLLETAEPFLNERLDYFPPMDMSIPLQDSGGPGVLGRVGSADVCLVNGVFGDPLLHVRLRHQRRSLLFDLGEGSRLPARIAHQVSDVFISHAHMDHIGGFFWLLRSRMGEFPPCRIYGPPGLVKHIEGFLQSILWDRVKANGPRFEVAEFHLDHLKRFQLQAGRTGVESLDDMAVADGVILKEDKFHIRTVMLDHHTPVLAYAYEPVRELNIRRDKLRARNLEPGPWLSDLKQQLLAENGSATLELPDGNIETVAALEDELVLSSPAKKLVYATDFSDTTDNRLRIQSLARYAHTFFCEACFLEQDREQAKRTGHLTTRACAEIAAAAEVARLVPFHFSQRYVKWPEQIYEEVQAICSSVVLPRSMHLFDKIGKPETIAAD